MAGRKIFEPFEVHEASNVQNFLMDQTVMRFDTTADRATQLPAPDEGQVSYVEQLGYHQWYDGSDWVRVQLLRQIQAATITPMPGPLPWDTVVRYGLDEVITNGTSGSDWITLGPNGVITPPVTGFIQAFAAIECDGATLLGRRLIDVVNDGVGFPNDPPFGRLDITPSTQSGIMTVTGQFPREDPARGIYAQGYFKERSDLPGAPPPPDGQGVEIFGGLLSVEILGVSF